MDFFFFYLQRSQFLLEKRVLASIFDLPQPSFTAQYERQRDGDENKSDDHQYRRTDYPRFQTFQLLQGVCTRKTINVLGILLLNTIIMLSYHNNEIIFNIVLPWMSTSLTYFFT